MTTRRALLFIPLFFVFLFALVLRRQWQRAQPLVPGGTLPAQTNWRKATSAERSAAIAPIRAQIKAFRANDYDKAISFQSQEMRRQFTSTSNFRAMMQRGYPQFAKPKSYTFGKAKASGDAALVMVSIVLKGADGVTVRAAYLMKKEGGGYRVSSVVGGGLLRRPLRPTPKGEFDPSLSV